MPINAPVLPALTAALAWPSLTALIARPIELVFALRRAWLTFSSPVTTSSACNISDAARRLGCLSRAVLIRGSSPTSRNSKLSCRCRAKRCTCQHYRNAFIAAHRVYCDTRFHRHQQFSLTRRIRRPPSLRGRYNGHMRHTYDVGVSIRRNLHIPGYAATLSESWLRRMPRFEGEVFLLGTAISAPVPFQNQ